MQNKFFLTREGKSHQGNDRLHFATTLNRTLSISDATELRDLLTELLEEPTLVTADIVTEPLAVENNGPKPFGA